MFVVWLLLCDCQIPISWGFWTFRDRTLCSKMVKILSIMENRGVPKFSHTVRNRSFQLRTTITFSSELRFARSWTLRKAR